MQQMDVIKVDTPPTLAPAIPAPDVFSFMDYREFLREWFKWKKQVVPHYSGTMFANKAGINSHNLLGMVIRGERNLGLSTIQGFIKACQLKSIRAQYFERLVVYTQSKDSEERAEVFEQLVQLGRKRGVENLKSIQNYGQFLKHWYVVAIYEMVNLKDFKADPDWIVARLKKTVARKDVEMALETLKNLNLIEWDAAVGKYVARDCALDIDVAKVDFWIRNFHRDYLRRAEQAIDGESIEERSLSSLTIAVSEKDLSILKDRISELRKQLNVEFSDREQNKDYVVALNMQFLILTENKNSKLNQRENENEIVE